MLVVNDNKRGVTVASKKHVLTTQLAMLRLRMMSPRTCEVAVAVSAMMGTLGKLALIAVSRL